MFSIPWFGMFVSTAIATQSSFSCLNSIPNSQPDEYPSIDRRRYAESVCNWSSYSFRFYGSIYIVCLDLPSVRRSIHKASEQRNRKLLWRSKRKWYKAERSALRCSQQIFSFLGTCIGSQGQTKPERSNKQSSKPHNNCSLYGCYCSLSWTFPTKKIA